MSGKLDAAVDDATPHDDDGQDAAVSNPCSLQLSFELAFFKPHRPWLDPAILAKIVIVTSPPHISSAIPDCVMLMYNLGVCARVHNLERTTRADTARYVHELVFLRP